MKFRRLYGIKNLIANYYCFFPTENHFNVFIMNILLPHAYYEFVNIKFDHNITQEDFRLLA